MQAAAMLLAAAGVALLFSRSFELSSENVPGDTLCRLAGLFCQAYLVAIDRSQGALAPLPALALYATGALAPLLPLALALERTSGRGTGRRCCCSRSAASAWGRPC